MKQAIKFAMVPTNKIMVEYNGPTIDQVNRTLAEELTKKELVMYSKSIDKVLRKQKLNVIDLNVFDKIDEITMKVYGLCLKDSLVTKARLKACKRYKVAFVDRDGLIDHLRMVENCNRNQFEQQEHKEMIDQFIKIVGYETAEAFTEAALKVRDGEDLDLSDLKVIAKVAAHSSMDFGLLRKDSKTKQAIEKACAEYGLDISDILGGTDVFNNIQ